MTLLRFDIEDTGVGIAPEDLNKLFAPFQQVGETARQTQGTGLGLAISRNLADLMGGTLIVTSTVGVGSVFRFDVALPVCASDDVYAPAQRLIVGVEGPAPTILVVDDIAENREVLAQLLTCWGCRVMEAENSADALQQAQRAHPAAIIADLRMPGMDGVALIQRIREIPELQHTVIIASSASVYRDDRQRSLDVGSYAFLPKPIDADALSELLRTSGVAKWRYQEGAISPPSDSVEMLPPLSVLKTLCDLANIGDILELRQQLGALARAEPALTPFVNRLQALAQRFQLGRIQTVLLEMLKKQTPAASVALPAKMLARLERAVMLADIQDIEKIITDVRAIDADTAEMLSRFAQNFEYMQIVTFVRSCRNGE